MNKFMQTLRSRKFWAAIVGMAVAVGLLNYSDSQQAELVAAVLAVVTSIGYMLGVAIEDAGTKKGP